MAPEKWDLGADRTISLEAVINEAISIKVGIDKGGQDDLSAIAVLGRCNRGEGDHFLLVDSPMDQSGRVREAEERHSL